MTEPVDFLFGFPGASVRFEPAYVQALDPTRSGRQIVTDLGPTLWEADYRTVDLRPTVLRLWKAKLNALGGGRTVFKGYDTTACYPLAYPKGAWPTGGSFNGIGVLADIDTDTNTDLKVSGVPAGYVFSVGDYLSFLMDDGSRALHHVMVGGAADGGGLSPWLTVEPFIRPGITVGGSPAVEVDLVKPSADMVIVPGSISAPSAISGRGSISFTARQTI
jgi:hypothetical protein